MGLILSVIGELYISVAGLLYALGSGAGYAVWYGVVKQISAQQAATLQLSVPIVAALGGVVESASALLHGDAPIDLLLTDIGLPRMSGHELADEARRVRPNLPVLFMTGYAESAKDRNQFSQPGTDILMKPFSMDELLAKLLRLMIPA